MPAGLHATVATPACAWVSATTASLTGMGTSTASAIFEGGNEVGGFAVSRMKGGKVD